MAYKMVPISYEEYCILRDAGAWAVAYYYVRVECDDEDLQASAH